MKLGTSLMLSAIFPIVFAIVVVLSLAAWFHSAAVPLPEEMGVLALLGALGLAMAGMILFYSRDILNKIKVLNEWIDAILKGNLDHRPPEASSKDEIGRLSQALSRMLLELKEAYGAVKKEADGYKQTAADMKRQVQASQTGMRHLTDALGRFKETHVETLDRERRQALNQVVRGVVHDFSEALTPILGTTELLRVHPDVLSDRAQVQRHFDAIDAAAGRAAKSLKDLAGVFHQCQVWEHVVDINHIVEEAIRATDRHRRDEERASGSTIRIRTRLGRIGAVGGEEAELQDAVEHLIRNAVEAMPNGGTVSLSTDISPDGRFVTIEVRDMGAGMTEEVRRHCFEPFYTTKSGARRGMGLTIVAGIVNRHCGTLKLETEAGKGTAVFVRLPLRDQVGAKGQARDAEHAPVGPRRILVVDDDPDSRATITHMLALLGHSVEAVATGADCLAKLEAGKFNMVLTDREMPGMGGDELASAIRAQCPAMPIIMITGFGYTMLAEADIPECVNAILPKPFRLSDLQAVLIQSFDGPAAGTRPSKGPSGGR